MSFDVESNKNVLLAHKKNVLIFYRVQSFAKRRYHHWPRKGVYSERIVGTLSHKDDTRYKVLI